jgi:hypothetical protein
MKEIQNGIAGRIEQRGLKEGNMGMGKEEGFGEGRKGNRKRGKEKKKGISGDGKGGFTGRDQGNPGTQGDGGISRGHQQGGGQGAGTASQGDPLQAPHRIRKGSLIDHLKRFF